jgi:hypothetical protein
MAPDVVATFVIGAQQFADVNPISRELRRNGKTIDGVRPANAELAMMHAEFGAMFQAYEVGVRGGHGVLTIRGLKACPWCRGDVKTLARALRLESLTVHDADGTIVVFRTSQDMLPLRQGGKAWN